MNMVPELATLRSEIDALDELLLDTLARRLAVVERVVKVKQAHGIPAVIPERVAEVIALAGARAARRGMPTDLAENVWRTLVAETIRYEEAALKQRIS